MCQDAWTCEGGSTSEQQGSHETKTNPTSGPCIPCQNSCFQQLNRIETTVVPSHDLKTHAQQSGRPHHRTNTGAAPFQTSLSCSARNPALYSDHTNRPPFTLAFRACALLSVVAAVGGFTRHEQPHRLPVARQLVHGRLCAFHDVAW